MNPVNPLSAIIGRKKDSSKNISHSNTSHSNTSHKTNNKTEFSNKKEKETNRNKKVLYSNPKKKINLEEKRLNTEYRNTGYNISNGLIKKRIKPNKEIHSLTQNNLNKGFHSGSCKNLPKPKENILSRNKNKIKEEEEKNKRIYFHNSFTGSLKKLSKEETKNKKDVLISTKNSSEESQTKDKKEKKEETFKSIQNLIEEDDLILECKYSFTNSNKKLKEDNNPSLIRRQTMDLSKCTQKLRLDLISENIETNKRIIKIFKSENSLILEPNSKKKIFKVNKMNERIKTMIETINKKIEIQQKQLLIDNQRKIKNISNIPNPTKLNPSKNIIKPKTNTVIKSPKKSNSKSKAEPKLIFTGHLEDYIIGNEIGKGSYAVVKLAYHKINGIKVAIKIYDKKEFTDSNNISAVKQEIEVMKSLKHENIVKLYESINTQQYIYVMMELATGISLFEYLKSKKDQRINEKECKELFSQIVKGINHCHLKNISHRDIKLENIILTDNCTKVKIIDFGFGIKSPITTIHKFFCGTPSYMPPEIVQKKGYSAQYADIWSLGILLYTLLYGTFPFKSNYETDLYEMIISGKFECNDTVSDNANKLIKRILKINPKQRPSAAEILSDEWFQIK
ncbi:MAG: serine/threonine-protein kinase [archaeon]|nr:serine/threonine-protein kinase [archaeon]